MAATERRAQVTYATLLVEGAVWSGGTRKHRAESRAAQPSRSGAGGGWQPTMTLLQSGATVAVTLLVLRTGIVNAVLVLACAVLLLCQPMVRTFLEVEPARGSMGRTESLLGALAGHREPSSEVPKDEKAGKSDETRMTISSLPPQLQPEMQRILGLVRRDFIEYWYCGISFGDPVFPNNAMASLEHVIAGIAMRMGQYRRADVATELSLTACTVLVAALRRRRQLLDSGRLTVASGSGLWQNDEARIETLRMTVSTLLAQTLPRAERSSKMVHSLLTEVMTKQLWTMLVSFSDPDVINGHIVKYGDRSMRTVAAAVALGDVSERADDLAERSVEQDSSTDAAALALDPLSSTSAPLTSTLGSLVETSAKPIASATEQTRGVLSEAFSSVSDALVGGEEGAGEKAGAAPEQPAGAAKAQPAERPSEGVTKEQLGAQMRTKKQMAARLASIGDDEKPPSLPPRDAEQRPRLPPRSGGEDEKPSLPQRSGGVDPPALPMDIPSGIGEPPLHPDLEKSLKSTSEAAAELDSAAGGAVSGAENASEEPKAPSASTTGPPTGDLLGLGPDEAADPPTGYSFSEHPQGRGQETNEKSASGAQASGAQATGAQASGAQASGAQATEVGSEQTKQVAERPEKDATQATGAPENASDANQASTSAAGALSSTSAAAETPAPTQAASADPRGAGAPGPTPPSKQDSRGGSPQAGRRPAPLPPKRAVHESPVTQVLRHRDSDQFDAFETFLLTHTHDEASGKSEGAVLLHLYSNLEMLESTTQHASTTAELFSSDANTVLSGAIAALPEHPARGRVPTPGADIRRVLVQTRDHGPVRSMDDLRPVQDALQQRLQQLWDAFEHVRPRGETSRPGSARSSQELPRAPAAAASYAYEPRRRASPRPRSDASMAQPAGRIPHDTHLESQTPVTISVVDVSENAERAGPVDLRTFQVLITIEDVASAVSGTGGYVLLRHWSQFEALQAELERVYAQRPGNHVLSEPPPALPAVRGKSSEAACEAVQRYLVELLTPRQPGAGYTDVSHMSLASYSTTQAVQRFIDKTRASEPVARAARGRGVPPNLISSIGGMGRSFASGVAGAAGSARKGLGQGLGQITAAPAAGAMPWPAPRVPRSRTPGYEPRQAPEQRAEAPAVAPRPEPSAETTVPQPRRVPSKDATEESPLPERKPTPAAPKSADAAPLDGAASAEAAGRAAAPGAQPAAAPASEPGAAPGGGAVPQDAEQQPTPRDVDALLSALFAVAHEAFNLQGAWTLRRGLLRVMEQIVRTTYSATVVSTLLYLASMLAPDALASWLTSIRESLWPGDVWQSESKPPRTNAEREATAQQAREIVLSYTPTQVAFALGIGRPQCMEALASVHETITDDVCAKDLHLALLLRVMDLSIGSARGK